MRAPPGPAARTPAVGGSTQRPSSRAAPVEARVRLHEIYTSLQGETTEAGRPCTFVRLTGCDLRCTWCDTPQAFSGGTLVTLSAVEERVASLGVRFVTVTGGEPLLQPSSFELVRRLVDRGFEVQVETGGHRDVSRLDPRARIILDLKAPGSGESARVRWENLEALRPEDQVKVVIACREDYEWARGVLAERLADGPAVVLLQPATGLQDAAELAEWILADRLDVRFCLQLHAVLWPGRTGR